MFGRLSSAVSSKGLLASLSRLVPRASSLHPKKPCFKIVQRACESRQERAIEEAPVPLGQTRATEGIFRTDG
jgi:hypothetical protein